MRTLVTSARAADRLAHARAFLETCDPRAPLTVLAATPEAGSDLVRALRRSTFGWRRLTLFRCAVELARPALLADGRALAGPLALEALWARVVFSLAAQGQLHRLTPLADRPGLGKALASTIDELRSLEVPPTALEPALSHAMAEFERALDERALADRPLVFRLATEALDASPDAFVAQPVVALDVPLAEGAPARFLAALAARATAVYATAVEGDEPTTERVARALGVTPTRLRDERPASPLAALQHHLFSTRQAAGTTHRLTDLFSAPGESRECVEIARRILQASRQTPFDRIAVLLRSPATYREPLEDAFRRAGVPAYFASGLPSPDPAGRALLALLRCREEHLSARRFSEYLSLAQVPKAETATGAPPQADRDRFERTTEAETLLPADKRPQLPTPPDDEALDPDAPVTAGRLRSPRQWERLIIDAAVIGGPHRWRHRLEGLERGKLRALRSPTLTEAHEQRLRRELADLGALRDFALPLLEDLWALPGQASWGDWLSALSALATRALKTPARVLSVLGELSPMSLVGPVELREVRAVLTERLSHVTEAPAARRYGQVFVAPVEAARGLSFERVFVPGLAERIFPQKVREDPLLPDARRAQLDPRLERNDARVARERVALHLAVGAAETQVVLSWPRVDAEHARPRVPSFYALEAARAVEGELPAYEELQRAAEAAAGARLAWPAPVDPARAIDETEYDLAVLDQVLRATGDVTGRARYLVEVNPHLSRALRMRYSRWNLSKWTPYDGLVQPPAAARTALERHLFSARPFSPTALEQFAACPYRFFLSAVQRLSPLEIPSEIEELGPLEKGSMTHAVQYRLLSALRDEGVPVTEATLEGGVFARLDEVIAQVSAQFADEFVPAIERVWKDGIEVMRADLREWLRKVARDERWAPWKFELGFGLGQRDDADPTSVPDPVELPQGLKLRGSIDLVERSADGHLRATDYKTGRARAKEGNVVGGGRHLQPVLYALVLERLFPEARVDGGQLFYCTQVGGFLTRPTQLDALARQHLGEVLLAIRGALEQGFFPAHPADRECRWCDFRAVCGPDEEARIAKLKKGNRPESKPLLMLRGLP